MSDQSNPNENGVNNEAASLPSPETTVIVGMTVEMTADGHVHVGPSPRSPRKPTLNDLDTLANRVQRDVRIKLTAEEITGTQQRLLQQAIMAQRQQAGAHTPGVPADETAKKPHS